MAPVPREPTVESDGTAVHVRYRDPAEFDTVCTPEWAEKAADSVVDGSELRVGKRADGDDWVPLSVCIPEPVDPEQAKLRADEILQRIAH